MFTFDFETKGIQPRPDYPPQPVGLAHDGGRKPRYIAFGHPTGNNALPVDCIDTLEAHWHEPLLCHNAAFDIAVAHERLGLPLPDGTKINDTMFLAFLLDPYGELGLKPLAERYLGIPPTERDMVRDWLYENKVVRKNVKRWGGFISEAPGSLVADYANGDVTRTRDLFKHLLPMVEARGMLPAYKRECDIMPMLLDNSAQGIPLDAKRLARDTKRYEQVLLDVERHLRMLWPKEIMGGVAPGNFDSGDELAECLQRDKRIVLPMTPSGKKVSTAKDSLLAAIPDCRVKGLLLYRSAIEKCLSTYMRPWLAQGANMHANWNQVRDYSDNGARTGRLSSSPNMQNLTNPEKYDELLEVMKRCRCDFDGFDFPNLRSYFVAPKGMVLFSRDYSQQELRMLAHYEAAEISQYFNHEEHVRRAFIEEHAAAMEQHAKQKAAWEKLHGKSDLFNRKTPAPPQAPPDPLAELNEFEKGLWRTGELSKAYASNETADLHILIKDMVLRTTGVEMTRKQAKTISFAKLYGAGAKKLAQQLGTTQEQAYRLIRAYERALPGVQHLQRGVHAIGRSGMSLRTIGGRAYYSPPPEWDEEQYRMRTFEYKLLNYLIQGSSADQTKEAMRNWWNDRLKHSSNGTRFLMTVHDQLVGCAPRKLVKAESAALDRYMVEAFTLDVPTKTDPTYGTNFGEMKK